MKANFGLLFEWPLKTDFTVLQIYTIKRTFVNSEDLDKKPQNADRGIPSGSELSAIIKVIFIFIRPLVKSA